MRKAKVFERMRVGGAWSRVEVGVGVFHGFGCDFEELENGARNYSTAIVEMDDGRIMNPAVEMVVFTAPPKS